MMRALLFLLIGLTANSIMAGQPDLAIVFVRDARGRPMRGAHAPSVQPQAWLGRRHRPAWTVELHFTVSDEYPYDPAGVGKHESWPLTPDTVHAGWRRHLRFRILDCFCADTYLLIRQGEEVMRVDLPDDPNERTTLVTRMEQRGAGSPPEVVRFRPGRYTLMDLAEGWNALEARIARRTEP